MANGIYSMNSFRGDTNYYSWDVERPRGLGGIPEQGAQVTPFMVSEADFQRPTPVPSPRGPAPLKLARATGNKRRNME